MSMATVYTTAFRVAECMPEQLSWIEIQSFKPRHCPQSPQHAGVRRLATRAGRALEAVTADVTRTNTLDIGRQWRGRASARDAGIGLPPPAPPLPPQADA